MVVNRLLGGEVSARYVPASALALAASLIDLWWTTRSCAVTAPGAGTAAFLDQPGSWHVLVDLASIALAGGLFVVPLYAILQVRSAAGKRSRIIAANNVVNALVTVVLVAVVSALLAGGVGVPSVLGASGFATLALISCWLLPETVFKAIVRGLLRLLYRV